MKAEKAAARHDWAFPDTDPLMARTRIEVRDVGAGSLSAFQEAARPPTSRTRARQSRIPPQGTHSWS